MHLLKSSTRLFLLPGEIVETSDSPPEDSDTETDTDADTDMDSDASPHTGADSGSRRGKRDARNTAFIEHPAELSDEFVSDDSVVGDESVPRSTVAEPGSDRSRILPEDLRATAADVPPVLRGHEEEESVDDSFPEEHSAYDIRALTSKSRTKNIDQFITSCFDTSIIPHDVSANLAMTRPVHRLTELVYAQKLGDIFHRFMSEMKEDLAVKELTKSLREILTSGPRLANRCRQFHSEGDVEFAFRASHLTIVAELINHLENRTGSDRLYPIRGVVVARNNNIRMLNWPNVPARSRRRVPLAQSTCHCYSTSQAEV
ncbi:hypothetical protein CPB85DRAFT_601381 [Mucidula mucida]|nr:hypothetical protein CPB85DRAFT_601381 [Mucidula mucida]